MKKVAIILSLIVMAMSFNSCKKCKQEHPRARVVNNGSEDVSVQIQTSGGNTVNINNILPGQSSDYVSYAPGGVDFTITVGSGGSAVNYNISVIMEECFEYDIVLDANNVISSVPTDRNE